MRYVIHVIPVGGPVEKFPAGEDKLDAKRRVREIATDRFPGASFRWSGDATVAHRKGRYLGTVSVDPAPGDE